MVVASNNRVNTVEIPTTRHYAFIHSRQYQEQPNGDDMGVITNDIKRQAHAKLVNMHQLFKAFSSGQSVLLSNFEVDNSNSIRFTSSSVFAIDIDDEQGITSPTDVLNDLKSVCAGLFYTFSHGIKGNRYRLVFQLDQAVTNEQDFKFLVRYVMQILKGKGLPVDEAAKSPTQVVRGGRKGYEINSINTKLVVSEWLPKAKSHYAEEMKALEKRREQMLKESMNNPVTFDELRAMCVAIGHIPSGHGYETTQKWLQVVYAIKYQSDIGVISDEQGFELFNIVSGEESNEKYWNSIKPSGFVSVGTIIYHAQENGYIHKNKYRHAMERVAESIETESIKVDKYLNKETAIDLLQRNQRLLVDSPTGSGKTTAFMNAFKELATAEYDFFIFAAPTIVLSEQIAKEHDVTCIKGGMVRTKHKITRCVQHGERIFVSTYDKALEIFSHLNESLNAESKVNFHIVVDEIHKYTEAYNYRFLTIDKLNALTSAATSFIGLSGTTEDVLKDGYDKLIKINTGDTKSPCTDYRVFTYGRIDSNTKMIDSGNRLLISVVAAMLKQSRVLLFINNRERIRTIGRLLKREGIKTAIVTSSEKQSATYTKIVEEESIDDDVEVVLTTVVLSDGITINNKLNWSCLVVNDSESPIWNPSTIKQISNRFRNQYRYFALFMRTPSEDYKEESRFYIESDYRFRLNVASNYVEYLNTEYKENTFDNFIASNVEKSHGIYYQSTKDDAEIVFNPLFLRHQSMLQKESYYRLNRQAFIKEVGRLVGREATGIFNVNKEAEENGAELSGLLSDLQQESESKKAESAELRQQFADYFTEDVYMAIVHSDDKSSLIHFKKNVHPDQYSATIRNARIACYETCKTVVEAVSRRADINSYTSDIESLTHIAVFRHVRKMTVTKAIYNNLLDLTDKALLVSEFRDITKNLSKTVKVNNRYVSQKDVRGVLNMFSQSKSRNKKERFTTLQPLTIESVAKKHGISQEQVKDSIAMFIKTQPKQRQKVMFQAVEKEYGITL